MNNGGYFSQDPEKLGPKVEEIVRNDLGASTEIPYTIVSANATPTGAGSVLSDMAGNLFGGKETLLMTVCFELAQPRPTSLHVHLVRQGTGAYLGRALFSTKLSKPVPGEVKLEDPKTFSSSKFVGDTAVAAKLNASKDIIKRVGKFARTECPNLKISAPRMFQVAPQNGTTMLVAATLPRSYAMGFKVSLDVQEFMDLAGLIEAAL